MAKAPGKQNPNQFEKINFIKDFFMDPCDAPWTMYALAFFGAALEAFVSLYSIDLSDIFWNAIGRRYGLGRYRGGRKGQKGSKRSRGFDPNENIGKQIGDWLKLPGQKIPMGLAFLWIAFGLLERLLFYLFLADVAIQFFYRWTSLMYESRYCKAQRQAVVLRVGDGTVYGGIFPPIPIPTNIVLKARGNISHGNGTLIIPKGYNGVFAGSCGWSPFPGQGPTTFSLRLIKLGTADPLDQMTIHLNDGEFGTASVNGEVVDGGSYQLLCDVQGGFGELVGAVMYGQVIPP